MVLGKVPGGYLCQGEEKAYAYFLQLMLELLNGVGRMRYWWPRMSLSAAPDWVLLVIPTGFGWCCVFVMMVEGGFSPSAYYLRIGR